MNNVRSKILSGGIQKFYPYITVLLDGSRKQISLGSFDTPEKAHEVFEKYKVLFTSSESDKLIKEYLLSKKTNDYMLSGDTVVINTPNGSFTISKCDYESCLKYTWGFSGKYVCTKIKGRRVFLQDFLLPHDEDHCVDHINRNPSDNTRDNLRIIPKYQNMFNKSRYSNSKYGNGILLSKRSGKFIVRIGYRNKIIYVGEYSLLNDAKIARKAAEKVVYVFDEQ